MTVLRQTLKQLPTGFKLFVHHCSAAPFEMAIASLAMWTGMMAFFDWTMASRAFNSALPAVLSTLFNLIYFIAGSFMVAGIGWAYRNVEAAGLIFLFTVLAGRVVTLMFLVGFNPETTAAIVQGSVFGFACIARLRIIFKNQLLVHASDIPELVSRQMRSSGLEP